MTELNLKKKKVKWIIIYLSVIIIFTALCLLPISIVYFVDTINTLLSINAYDDYLLVRRVLHLPISIIALVVEFCFLFVWLHRYITINKITFPNEEIKSIIIKKIIILKVFSTVGLKIRTNSGTHIYIFTSENDNQLVNNIKKLRNITITIKCYKDTKIVKKLDKKTFNV